MDGSMYGYMKPGLVHFKAFPELMQSHATYVKTLRRIAEDDFWTAVEIGPCKDTRDRDIARKILEISHLTVAYATQPTAFPMKLNPHHADPAERKRVLGIIKGCVDEAYQLVIANTKRVIREAWLTLDGLAKVRCPKPG